MRYGKKVWKEGMRYYVYANLVLLSTVPKPGAVLELLVWEMRSRSVGDGEKKRSRKLLDKSSIRGWK